MSQDVVKVLALALLSPIADEYTILDTLCDTHGAVLPNEIDEDRQALGMRHALRGEGRRQR